MKLLNIPVESAIILKRPSSICKSPYVADIIINDKEIHIGKSYKDELTNRLNLL